VGQALAQPPSRKELASEKKCSGSIPARTSNFLLSASRIDIADCQSGSGFQFDPILAAP
jgi:hypothetical protein